eukprot:Rmarinus@m.17873
MIRKPQNHIVYPSDPATLRKQLQQKDAEIVASNAKISSLESAFRDLEVRRVRERIELDTVKEKLEATELRNREYEAKMQDMQATIDNLQFQLAEAEIKTDDLKEKVVTVRQSAERESITMTESRAQLQARLQEYRDKISELEDKLCVSAETIATQHAELRQMADKSRDLENAVEHRRSEYLEVRQKSIDEETQLRQRIIELEKVMADFECANEELKNDDLVKTAYIKKREEEFAIMQEEMRETHRRNTVLKEDLDSAKRLCELREREANNFEARTQELEDDLEARSSEVVSLLQKTRELETRSTRLEATLAQATRKLKELDSNRISRESELSTLRERYHMIQNELKSNKAVLKEVDAERTLLTDRLKARTAEVEDLANELQNIRRRYHADSHAAPPTPSQKSAAVAIEASIGQVRTIGADSASGASAARAIAVEEAGMAVEGLRQVMAQIDGTVKEADDALEEVLSQLGPGVGTLGIIGSSARSRLEQVRIKIGELVERIIRAHVSVTKELEVVRATDKLAEEERVSARKLRDEAEQNRAETARALEQLRRQKRTAQETEERLKAERERVRREHESLTTRLRELESKAENLDNAWDELDKERRRARDSRDSSSGWSDAKRMSQRVVALEEKLSSTQEDLAKALDALRGRGRVLSSSNGPHDSARRYPPHSSDLDDELDLVEEGNGGGVLREAKRILRGAGVQQLECDDQEGDYVLAKGERRE